MHPIFIGLPVAFYEYPHGSSVTRYYLPPSNPLFEPSSDPLMKPCLASFPKTSNSGRCNQTESKFEFLSLGVLEILLPTRRHALSLETKGSRKEAVCFPFGQKILCSPFQRIPPPLPPTTKLVISVF
jgi:hypothetical protein